MEALAELFAEDVVWHTQAATRSQASLRDALPPLRHWTFASLAKEFELSDGTYAVELHHVLADDDHRGALLRCTAQRDGKTLDMNYVLVFHTAAARSPRLEDWGATRKRPTNSGRRRRYRLIRHDQTRTAMMRASFP
jgi:ketosteroid isomerase-like protein